MLSESSCTCELRDTPEITLGKKLLSVGSDVFRLQVLGGPSLAVNLLDRTEQLFDADVELSNEDVLILGLIRLLERRKNGIRDVWKRAGGEDGGATVDKTSLPGGDVEAHEAFLERPIEESTGNDARPADLVLLCAEVVDGGGLGRKNGVVQRGELGVPGWRAELAGVEALDAGCNGGVDKDVLAAGSEAGDHAHHDVLALHRELKLRLIGVVCLEDLDAIRKDRGGLLASQDADVVGASLQESFEDWDAKISASLFCN